MESNEVEDIDFLYKYRSINEYTIKSLRNNEFYFSKPYEFNDPFDTKLNVTYEGSKSEWKNYLKSIGFNESQRKILLSKLREANYDITNFSNYDKDKYFNSEEMVIILSLSEISDNILMWSHYSNNHEGICLGFKTTKTAESLGLLFNDDKLKYFPDSTLPFLPAFKVDYKKEMPKKYNGLKSDPHDLFKFAETKHNDWQYEKERRIIYLYSDVGKQIIKFNKSILSQVIFGIKTPEKDIEKITEIVNKNYIDKGINVDFLKAEPCPGKYKLKIVPYEK